MELAILVVNIILTVIMLAIFGVWIYLLFYLIKSYERSPRLKSFDKPQISKFPKISVILPARNEEIYISRCLDSILNQDYPNFEIIAINDSSFLAGRITLILGNLLICGLSKDFSRGE